MSKPADSSKASNWQPASGKDAQARNHLHIERRTRRPPLLKARWSPSISKALIVHGLLLELCVKARWHTKLLAELKIPPSARLPNSLIAEMLLPPWRIIATMPPSVQGNIALQIPNSGGGPNSSGKSQIKQGVA